ncbi:MAG: SPFH domain-containing protein [Planctomycetota bacterium]|nr:SPFH domain-containing protein [Planctomycetota bacterium]MEC8494836.1 SPFH domain-containing protein [Planctomycetota bacterium]MEC8512504.1 SPFH domain-containing protein [Planctomycetota bacterium]
MNAPRQIKRAVVIALLLAVGWSSVFTVTPSTQAVVTRFGAPVRDLDPGLHFKLPWPAEAVARTPGPQASLQMPVGYRLVDERAGIAPPPRMMHWLTGDANIVELRANVLYRIKDVRAWLFGASRVHDEADGSFESPEFALRRLAEAALTQRCSRLSVDDVLVSAAASIAADARAAIQEDADRLGLGVSISAVQLLDQAPLRSVASDFLAVQDAKTNGARSVQSARTRAERDLTEAQRARDTMLQEARTEAQAVVREAEAGHTAFAELSAVLGGLDSLVGRRYVADGVGRVLSGVTVDKVQPGTAERPAVYVGTRGR